MIKVAVLLWKSMAATMQSLTAVFGQQQTINSPNSSGYESSVLTSQICENNHINSLHIKYIKKAKQNQPYTNDMRKNYLFYKPT
jgi:hypothetical protein